MEGHKIEIALCMGSSCFARGNKSLLDSIEMLTRENGWEDRIALSGMRCQDMCSGGPNVRIDGQLYQGLDAGSLLDLLADRLGIERPGNSGYLSAKKNRPGKEM